MMRKIINIILIVVSIFILSSFRLVKLQDRNVTYRLSKSIVLQINEETKNMTETQIINYSLNLTSEKLQFAKKNNLSYGKANCIGYAQFCSAVCNQAFKNNGYKCRTKPVVGYITNCGINICNITKQVMLNKHWQNFVKDHDFVELQINNKIYYFDPSMYDILGNKCLTVKYN